MVLLSEARDDVLNGRHTFAFKVADRTTQYLRQIKHFSDSTCWLDLRADDNSKQQTADSKQQTADSKQQTANSGQQTADSKQRTANSGQQTAESGQPTAGAGGTSRRQTAEQLSAACCPLFATSVAYESCSGAGRGEEPRHRCAWLGRSGAFAPFQVWLRLNRSQPNARSR